MMEKGRLDVKIRSRGDGAVVEALGDQVTLLLKE